MLSHSITAGAAEIGRVQHLFFLFFGSSVLDGAARATAQHLLVRFFLGRRRREASRGGNTGGHWPERGARATTPLVAGLRAAAGYREIASRFPPRFLTDSNRSGRGAGKAWGVSRKV